MDTILTVIGGLLVLTVLVVSHEFGHFIVGKKSGIKINEFSAGFGPKLISKKSKKDGIVYSIRALPLGGFVAFHGEDEDMPDDPDAFNNAPLFKRALTIAAGPVFNVIFAFILTLIVLTCYGDYTPVVSELVEGMPAMEAGILPGDRIVGVDGENIDFITEFNIAFENSDSDSIDIRIERDGEKMNFDVPFSSDENGDKKIGIMYVQERHRFSFTDSVRVSFKWLWTLTKEMYKSIGDLFFRGKGIENYSGPVGTVTVIGSAVRGGAEVLLRICTILSLNLAIMNLLPFPALDGGRLVLLLIEWIRGKALPRDKEAIINLIGMAILFAFMIYLTYSDIVKLF